MATPSALHRWTALQALTFLSMLAVLVQGRNHRGDAACPRFSCGPLGNVSFPFRRAGDPAGCGDKSGELACTDAKATLRIADATYYVTSINYTDSTFQIIDTNLDLHSSCPRLPRWNRRPHEYLDGTAEHQLRPFDYDDVGADLALGTYNLASFVECSQEVKNYGMYMPVTCMSTSDSFVYVLTSPGASRVENLEPWCRYLAMTPLGGPENRLDIGATALENASYTDVVKSMRTGFTVRFTPFTSFKDYLLRLILTFREEPMQRGSIILNPDLYIIQCGIEAAPSPYVRVCLIILLFVTRIFKWINGPYRFLWGYLAVWTFFAYKYWKTRITIDAVEKFLRMQQMLTPTRYAYTDITAVTGHFRDKLGQGGYGSVFKGVLLNDFHVAVKMLAGNSNCNGKDFISEVSTIGRIHHVNVVRLVGFCSEEMRALIYEYMPRGSLDKYIFSVEKSFSWDKLIKIALGIARGINYLHQGCEMQILHFDIKPHNILLDSNFVPKVADFGLAKLYPRDDSFVPSRALRGTIGYIAPEMISRSFGVISSKSDVYSFGMLLLEMAGGRRHADPNAANSSQAYYPSWVYDRLTQQDNVGEISAHVDTEMHELERKLCIVGLWYIQMKSHDRPTMSEVIEMLEGGVDGLQMPSRPFFCDEGHIHTEETYHLSSEMTEISEEDMSENIGV